MNAKQLVDAIRLSYEIRQPLFIWGNPGIGKSQIVSQAARDMGINLYDLRATQLDPVDTRGMPYVESGLTKWARPTFLPSEGNGVLFIDEFNSSNQMVMASFYQLLTDYRLGDHPMSDGYSIIAAGNNESDRAIVNRMGTALNGRFCHVTLEVSVDDWVEWALNNGLPTELIAFIRFRPELLHKFDPKSSDKSQPNPRNWEWVGKMFSRMKPAIEYDMYRGRVGDGAASEFLGFLKIFRSIPNPDLIIMNPDTGDIPTDPATLYALTGAIASKATNINFERVCRYSNRLPAEFNVLLVRDALQRDTTLSSTRAFIQWASDNKDVVI